SRIVEHVRHRSLRRPGMLMPERWRWCRFPAFALLAAGCHEDANDVEDETAAAGSEIVVEGTSRTLATFGPATAFVSDEPSSGQWSQPIIWPVAGVHVH